MPQLGDFLNRFRPAGAPGAASRAGVPADRSAELAAELGPVLVLLGDTQDKCARIVADAEREAARVAAKARADAERIAADAVGRAEVARAEAAAEMLDSARAQAAAAELAAAERARARPGPSEHDVRELIQAAIELVRSLAEGGGGQ